MPRRVVATYQGVAIEYDGGHYFVRMKSRTGSPLYHKSGSERGAKNFIGRAIRAGAQVVAAPWEPMPFSRDPLAGQSRRNPGDDREDVTERRMSETYGAHNAIKLGPSMTATERALLDKLPPELEIGFVSKALLYSPAIRHAAYGKADRTALFKLIKRGLLRVERDRRRDMEYLVKVQSNPSRSRPSARTAPARRAYVRNPQVTVFKANPGRARALLQSERVYEIAYKHVANNRAYKHKFEKGVCLELLPDGSFRVYSKTGKRLWKDYPNSRG